MSNLIPEVGSSGIYKLRAPFNTRLAQDLRYTCIAVRRLADIVAAGGDPKDLHYTSNGLSDAQYDADVANGVCIVTLQSDGSGVVYVPSSYIESYPSMGGVPYRAIALVVSLGAIPDSLDLTYLKTRIRGVVKDTIGVDRELQTVTTSPVSLIEQGTHETLEAARLAIVSESNTDYARALAAETALASARQHIAELEAYIRSQQP